MKKGRTNKQDGEIYDTILPGQTFEEDNWSIILLWLGQETLKLSPIFKVRSLYNDICPLFQVIFTLSRIYTRY